MNKEPKKYKGLLEQAREKNKRLGYGDIRKNWSEKEYEEQRRNLLFEKRIGRPAVGAPQIIEEVQNLENGENLSNNFEVIPLMKLEDLKEDIWDDNDYCPF